MKAAFEAFKAEAARELHAKDFEVAATTEIAASFLDVGALAPELFAHRGAPLERERGVETRGHVERRRPLRGGARLCAVTKALRPVVPQSNMSYLW